MKNCLSWFVLIAAELISFDIYGKIFLHLFANGGFSLPADLNCFRTHAALVLGQSSVTAAAAAKVCSFKYPPPFLLVAAPLAWLRPIWAYIFMSGVSSACLISAALAIKIPWRAVALGIASPVALLSLVIGQTGGIVSALLLLSLGLASTTPSIAGIAAGCLIIKPQFGVLLPVCYLASRNWTALREAALTTMLLCALSYACFGAGIWYDFLTDGPTVMGGTLNLPWEQNFQNIMVSPFMTLRSLGAGLLMSYATQIIVTILTVGLAWSLWSPRHDADERTRIVATMCLIPLATPYAYIYDLPGLGLVLAGYVAQTGWRDLLPVTAFWIITSLYILISMTSFLTGSIFLLLLLTFIWPGDRDLRYFRKFTLIHGLFLKHE